MTIREQIVGRLEETGLPEEFIDTVTEDMEELLVEIAAEQMSAVRGGIIEIPAAWKQAVVKKNELVIQLEATSDKFPLLSMVDRRAGFVIQGSQMDFEAGNGTSGTSGTDDSNQEDFLREVEDADGDEEAA